MQRLLGLVTLVPLVVVAQFVPPVPILQAGYPAGFRVFIPDFPGCQQFAFHGKINSPFLNDNELGSIYQEVLIPQNGFWIIQDVRLVLSAGDVIYFWTNIVKDGINYPKRNQTWKVPEPKNAVDILSPIKPPNEPPQKTQATESTAADKKTTEATTAATPNEVTSTSPMAPTTNIQTTTETLLTTKDAETTKAMSETTTKSDSTTETTLTTQAPTFPTIPETPMPKVKNTENSPLTEDVEELTTPFPLERPISGEFPIVPPQIPYPGPFPPPLKPMMPSSGPGFEICSNPWIFEERPGDSRTQKLERQVAKLQCQLGLFQRGYNQLSNTVETELTDLKKLIYTMVGRMATLESALRSSPFF